MFLLTVSHLLVLLANNILTTIPTYQLLDHQPQAKSAEGFFIVSIIGCKAEFLNADESKIKIPTIIRIPANMANKAVGDNFLTKYPFLKKQK